MVVVRGGVTILVTKNHAFHKARNQHSTYGRVNYTRDFRGWKVNAREGEREKMVVCIEDQHKGGREKKIGL